MKSGLLIKKQFKVYDKSLLEQKQISLKCTMTMANTCWWHCSIVDEMTIVIGIDNNAEWSTSGLLIYKKFSLKCTNGKPQDVISIYTINGCCVSEYYKIIILENPFV